MEERVVFTKEMKKTHTILAPDMLEIHFELLKNVFNNAGYKLEILKNNGRPVVDSGLKYTHNDTCYPALLVVGQFIDALENGGYDVNKVALIMTQTGGGCRASNYINLIRKALKKAGFGQIPVISLNFSSLEKNPGFKLDFKIMRRLFSGIVYGDLLMLLRNQLIAYEENKGETLKLVDDWTKKLTSELIESKAVSTKAMRKNLNAVVDDFAKIKIIEKDLVKVGVVGEIYIKYSELGNNKLEKFLFSQDCEVMVPGLMAFIVYNVDVRIEDILLYGGRKSSIWIYKRVMSYFQKIESLIIDAVKRYPRLTPPSAYIHTKALSKDVISWGNKMGEGWLLTAEMLELCESGYENIVCAQPFGCLPNHIVGKGMIRKVMGVYPNANIVSIDYDPGSTSVNQENRIKLMLSIGKEALNKKDAI